MQGFGKVFTNKYVFVYTNALLARELFVFGIVFTRRGNSPYERSELVMTICHYRTYQTFMKMMFDIEVRPYGNTLDCSIHKKLYSFWQAGRFQQELFSTRDCRLSSFACLLDKTISASKAFRPIFRSLCVILIFNINHLVRANP